MYNHIWYENREEKAEFYGNVNENRKSFCYVDKYNWESQFTFLWDTLESLQGIS